MQAPIANIPVDEYFRRDAESEVRLEYWNGQVVAMAGETPAHSTVKDNVFRALADQRPDCTVRTASLRVQAPGYGRENYAYPDGMMVCGRYMTRR